MKIKNFKYALKNESGFSLLEILVSLVILSFVLITFFSFSNQALFFSTKNEDKLVAYNLARKTLNIVTENYTGSSQNLVISCSNFDTNYHPKLKEALEPSSCFYKVNHKTYYPEIILTKQTLSFTTPTLYVVHVKIFDSADVTKRTLLSETFGYVRGGN
ncbi:MULTISPECIES: type IV pilus modification PilV family protein [Bacillus]|uniref:type IV pilus modification PilV family protein n=1 Tax=Bacillus TaxID=1386 RepID=UPI000BB68650|nr:MULTISPECIES: type II secretion system protein [Bacillus]